MFSFAFFYLRVLADLKEIVRRRKQNVILKIAIISDTESFGGAAIATSRLAYSLNQIGLDVVRIVGVRGIEPLCPV